MRPKRLSIGLHGSAFHTLQPNGKMKYEDYAKRIQKTLYYGKLPSMDRPSFPVTEILVDKFGKLCKQDGFNQLNLHDASSICYDACVTPCSVIVALLYLERLRTQNPEYLASASPSKVLIVALMVASKYLYDDGEEDEVFNDEWAASAAMLISDLNDAEREFLGAIDWNLYVDIKTFLDGLLSMESLIAKAKGEQRGYFVYSDLLSLSHTLPPILGSFVQLVGSAFLVCLVSYTATVFVIVAGTVATKSCATLLTNRVRLSLVSNPIAEQSFNQTICSTNTLEDIEVQIEGTPVEFELPEQEPDTKSTPALTFSKRIAALRTLTAALLFASSSKCEDESSSFSPANFSPSHSFLCCDPMFSGGGSTCGIRDEQEQFRKNESLFACNFCTQHLPREKILRSRKLHRHWRKNTTRISDYSDVPTANPLPFDQFLPDSPCQYGQISQPEFRVQLDINSQNAYSLDELGMLGIPSDERRIHSNASPSLFAWDKDLNWCSPLPILLDEKDPSSNKSELSTEIHSFLNPVELWSSLFQFNFVSDTVKTYSFLELDWRRQKVIVT